MQVVVDQIPPNVLVSNCVTKTFDFQSVTEAELHDIVIPLSLQVAAPCTGEWRVGRCERAFGCRLLAVYLEGLA